MPSIENIISLPHAAKSIASHSSGKTLASCVLVSLSFHNAFIPYLWYHVDRANGELTPSAEAISKYGQHIRSATLSEMEDFRLFSNYCPNLTNLASPSSRLDWAELATSVSPRFPKMESLNLRYNWEHSGFLEFLTPLKNLRSLTLQYYERRFPTACMATLLTHCHRQAVRLERLEIIGKIVGTALDFDDEQDGVTTPIPSGTNGSNDAAATQASTHGTIANSVKVPTTLESFVFRRLQYDSSFNSHPTNLMLAILRQGTRLQEISLPEMDASQMDLLCGWLRNKHQPSTLAAIHFGPFTPWADLNQADKALSSLVLSLNSNTLRQLTFQSGHVGTRVLEAVLSHHSHSIQVLDVGYGSTVTQMTSSLAHAFLTHCPSLNVLKVGNGVPSAIMCGKDAINDGQPWACKNLEVLHLSIGGFCHQSEAALCQTHNECLSQERKVMEQLGRLRNLRELDTSVYPRLDPAVQNVAGEMVSPVGALPHLTWTLEAGLDCLASLKSLELFYCYGVGHKARVPEVKWMKQHWPFLKFLSCGWDQGLFEEEIKTWQRLHLPKVHENMALIRWLE